VSSAELHLEARLNEVRLEEARLKYFPAPSAV
jgi:hypothetical protein